MMEDENKSRKGRWSVLQAIFGNDWSPNHPTRMNLIPLAGLSAKQIVQAAAKQMGSQQLFGTDDVAATKIAELTASNDALRRLNTSKQDSLKHSNARAKVLHDSYAKLTAIVNKTNNRLNVHFELDGDNDPNDIRARIETFSDDNMSKEVKEVLQEIPVKPRITYRLSAFERRQNDAVLASRTLQRMNTARTQLAHDNFAAKNPGTLSYGANGLIRAMTILGDANQVFKADLQSALNPVSRMDNINTCAVMEEKGVSQTAWAHLAQDANGPKHVKSFRWKGMSNAQRQAPGAAAAVKSAETENIESTLRAQRKGRKMASPEDMRIASAVTTKAAIDLLGMEVDEALNGHTREIGKHLTALFNAGNNFFLPTLTFHHLPNSNIFLASLR